MKIPLEPNNIYHIYNHANGKENLFENEENFTFFLRDMLNILILLHILTHIV